MRKPGQPHGRSDAFTWAMKRILSGFQRFRSQVYPAQREHFRQLAGKQQPETLFITCADSRIVPDLIMQTEPGDLFICRTAGNIVPPHGDGEGGVSATIEYAVAGLGVRDIIVCGHSDCGGMHGVLFPEKLAKLPATRSWLRYADAAGQIIRDNHPGLSGGEALWAVTKQNVAMQLSHLRTHPSVASRLAKGSLNIHGWIYDIPNGQISALDSSTGQFSQVESQLVAVAS